MKRMTTQIMNKFNEVSEPSLSKKHSRVVVRPTMSSFLVLCNALLLPFLYYLGHQSARQASLGEQQTIALRKVQNTSYEAGVPQHPFQGGLTMSTLEASSMEISSLVAENQQQVKALADADADAEKPDMDHCRNLFHSQVVPYFLCCQSFWVEGLSMCWTNSDICFHYHCHLVSFSIFTSSKGTRGGG